MPLASALLFAAAALLALATCVLVRWPPTARASEVPGMAAGAAAVLCLLTAAAWLP